MIRLMVLLLMASPMWGGYGYYILHTPASSQVSGGPHTDFPVLIDTTDNALRVTGSGGNVTDTQGDDIQPASDAACTSFLTFERIAYDGTTGRVRMHVLVSSLSGSSNIYLCFGDASVTTDQSNAAGTWNSGYGAVYHLGDGSTVSTTDSKNGLTLTNTGPVNATTGKIYGGAGTNWSSTVYMERASNASIVYSGSWTVSVWGNASSCGVYPTAVFKGQNPTRNYQLDLGNSDCKPRAIMSQSGAYKVATATSAVSTGTWVHLAARYDGSNIEIFVNGVSDGSAAATGSPDNNGTDKLKVGIFEHAGGYTEPWLGTLDEVRIQGVARSDDWLLTEYRSGTPSSFWTVGSATAVGGSVPRRRIIIQ